MEKNLKYLLIFVFIIFWVIAIIIGYKKGKKNRTQRYVSENIIHLDKNLSSVPVKEKLLQPKPILFKLNPQVFEPYDYSLKIDNMKEKLTIINEKGDEVKPSQSDKMVFDSFTLNILDHDLRKEESLKKVIQFPIEKGPEEEFYKGMVEPKDETTNMEMKEQIAQTNLLKKPEHLIYTN